MKKFIIVLAKYGILLLLIFNGIAILSLFMLKKSNFYKPQFIENGLTTKDYDYVVLGSSTGLTTLDTKQIDSITGKKGINISMDDSAISSHYLMLQHFLTLKNKTKTLVLTVSPWNANVITPKLNGNDYRFLPYIYNDFVYDYYNDLEKSYFKPLTYSRFLPIIGLSYYNTELFYPSIVAAFQPQKRNRFDDKGNYSYPSDVHPKPSDLKISHLKNLNPYLFKIEKLCAENNIRLVYYLSPMYQTKMVTEDNRNYINHSNLLKDARLFYDEVHVSMVGRRLASEAFAEEFQKSN